MMDVKFEILANVLVAPSTIYKSLLPDHVVNETIDDMLSFMLNGTRGTVYVIDIRIPLLRRQALLYVKHLDELYIIINDVVSRMMDVDVDIRYIFNIVDRVELLQKFAYRYFGDESNSIEIISGNVGSLKFQHKGAI